jgi:hypothetical protein
MERTRSDEACRCCEVLPGHRREGVRDPWIAVVGVVLDNDEPATRMQVHRQHPDHIHLVASRHEMQAVRGYQAVQHGELKRLGEIACDRFESDRGVVGGQGLGVLGQSSAISINGHDRAPGSEQIRERKGERARSGTDVGPRLVGLYRVPKEGDMVGVVHPSKRPFARLERHDDGADDAQVAGPAKGAVAIARRQGDDVPAVGLRTDAHGGRLPSGLGSSDFDRTSGDIASGADEFSQLLRCVPHESLRAGSRRSRGWPGRGS